MLYNIFVLIRRYIELPNSYCILAALLCVLFLLGLWVGSVLQQIVIHDLSFLELLGETGQQTFHFYSLISGKYRDRKDVS